MTANSNNSVKAILFFSVDIINSTKFKFQNKEWKKYIKNFYDDFPETFKNKIDTEKTNFKRIQVKNKKKVELPYPKVWKYIGDEILFYEYINDFYEEVIFSIIAFRNAIIDYNQNVAHKLKVKGTVWFANINQEYDNYEIQTKIGENQNHDFIGHSVDIGFRLSKFSDSEKLVISVETAILLIRDNYLTLEDKGINIYFDGTENLKGLKNDLGDYPKIWIDLMDDKRIENDNELAYIKRQIQKTCLSNILRYCQKYIEVNNNKLKYPKIPRDRIFSV